MAHCNTIFHQMLKLIPRHHFAKLEAQHGTGRQARSFTRRSQLMAKWRKAAKHIPLSMRQIQKKFGAEKACQKHLFRLPWPTLRPGPGLPTGWPDPG